MGRHFQNAPVWAIDIGTEKRNLSPSAIGIDKPFIVLVFQAVGMDRPFRNSIVWDSRYR